ncbi:DUF192 domain-containing protein [bacterium]|nr:DUF192 domain-containing protein [candidate division CSSED10-310 bacterium]
MQRRTIITLTVLIIAAGSIWGWDHYRYGLPGIPPPADPRAQTGLPIIAVTCPNHVRIAAEVVTTPRQQQKGLMYRETIAPRTGMMFIYEEEKYQQIWMKNVRVPLDIVFLNADKVITHIEKHLSAPAPDTPDESIPKTTGYGRYVLELGAGEADRLGLAKGMRLAFER